MSASAIAARSVDLEALLEHHRSELVGHCSRMLGSASEAEDAVQETLLRAWRGFDRFEGRAALRSWLYRIATNVTIDMMSARQRRALPIDLGPALNEGEPTGDALPEATWIQPLPDRRGSPAGGDPTQVAEMREGVRLAFWAALQHLPPRQRAVLILRAVLSWRAAEVAEFLETTVASVNSALQRARSTLASGVVDDVDPATPVDAEQRSILARHVDALQRYDLDSLASLNR